MSWSWKLIRIAGIDIRVHVTFFVLLLWIALAELPRGSAAMLGSLVFILSLFVCVVLHELGHSLQAMRFGIAVRDITLLPIGGVARLERMPEDPRQELQVALAGPLVNVVIAAALYFGMGSARLVGLSGPDAFASGSFLARLLSLNIVLAVFNLIPAFPMDGGRVLRAYLAQRMNYLDATHWAARVGQGIALVFGLIGLFGNPILMFIALFVYMGAQSEDSMVQARAWLHDVPVSAAMITSPIVLSPTDPLARAVEASYRGYQDDFPVVLNGKVIGVVTRNDLLAALHTHRPEDLVQDIMRTDFVSVSPHEPLHELQAKMAMCDCQALPVVKDGELRGMVSVANLGRFLAFRKAMAKA